MAQRKSNRAKLFIIQDAIFGAIISSLFVLFGANGAFATTSAVDEVTITVPASCSLTNTIGSPHTATIETGVYQDNIGETTFKVFCNDNEGFAVYAVGYTNDTFGNTTMKPSTLAVSNAIATGTATSGSTSNWAMKLMAVSGDYAPTLETGFNDYHVIPDTYTKVASYASNTDSSTGSSFKSTYSAFISQTQPADSYAGKVKYTVVNPASAVAPTETPQLTYMQDFTKAMCMERASSSNYTVVDRRDNKRYTVRYINGDCWMTQDLKIEGTISADYSNFEGEDFNTCEYNIDEYYYQEYDTSDYIPMCYENGQYLYYNYASATAGSITGYENEDEAEYDICPSGWRLPSYDKFSGIIGYKNEFSPVKNGSISLSASFANGTGYWWSATAQSEQNRYVLTYDEHDNDDLNITGVINGYYFYHSRFDGYSIRCIRST